MSAHGRRTRAKGADWRLAVARFPHLRRGEETAVAIDTTDDEDATVRQGRGGVAEIHDKALDAIDEAITKFRSDLKAMKLVSQPDGSITEEPVMRLMPQDVALVIDRLQVLFAKPSSITQHQGLNASTELSVESLSEFLERTRGLGGPPPMEKSPLPRRQRLDD